jgi:hypothetical protein
LDGAEHIERSDCINAKIPARFKTQQAAGSTTRIRKAASGKSRPKKKKQYNNMERDT